MKEQPMFNDGERAALVSLLLEMVNVDHSVAYEELIVTNNIHSRFSISTNDFNAGRNLDPVHALYVVKNMTDVQKRTVAQLLVEVIDADELVTDEEINLLNFICTATGLDLLFP
jgi:uncharacterized tellurite resistance protein B-like protein